MKKFILPIVTVAVLCLVHLATIANAAPTTTIVQNLRITGLGSTGNPCVTIKNAAGDTATSTCGSGGGSSASGTVGAVQLSDGSGNFTNDANLYWASSTNELFVGNIIEGIGNDLYLTSPGQNSIIDLQANGTIQLNYQPSASFVINPIGGAGAASLDASLLTANRSYQFPDGSGVFCVNNYNCGYLFAASSTGNALSIQKSTSTTSTLVTFLLDLSSYLTRALTSLNGATSSAQTIVGGSGVSVSTVAGSANSTTTITNTGVTSFNGATGTVSGVNSFNGATGTVTGVSSLSNNSSAGGIDFSASTGTSLTGVLHSLAITQFTGVLPIANGGTNATSAAAALSNLGGISTSTYNASITVATAGPLGGGGKLSDNGTLSLTCATCITTSTYNASITISTAAPLTGGGSLSNGGTLSLACPTCGSGGATTTINGVNGPTFTFNIVAVSSTNSSVSTSSATVNLNIPGLPRTCNFIVSSQSGADYGATQLATAVNAAANTTNYPNGAAICLPDVSAYVVTSTLKLANGVGIIGLGHQSAINFAASSAGTANTPGSQLFAASGSNPGHIVLANLILQQTSSSAPYAGTALDLSNMALTYTSNIQSLGWKYAVYANDTNNNTFYNDLENWSSFDDNGIYVSSTNPVNRNTFKDFRIATNSSLSSSTKYGLYLNKGQDNVFTGDDFEPAKASGTIGIDLETTNAINTYFYGAYLEANQTSTILHNAVRTSFFGTQECCHISTDIQQNGDTYTLFQNYDDNFGIPFNNSLPGTSTDPSGNSLSWTFQNNQSFAHVGSSLMLFQLLNGTDTSNVLKLKNAGIGNTLLATDGSNNAQLTVGATGTFIGPAQLLAAGGKLFSMTSTSTSYVSTAGSVSLIGSGVGTTTIPANFLRAGDTIQLMGQCHAKWTANPTSTIQFFFGGKIVAQNGASGTQAFSTNNGTSRNCQYEVDMTIISTGASARATADGYMLFTTSNTSNNRFGIDSTSTLNGAASLDFAIDTTVANKVDFQYTMATTTANDVVTSTIAYINILRSQ
jgi:hypothetical protein